MGRFEELGYTNNDFGPNRTFVTARAGHAAIATNVIQVRAVKPEIELVRDFINSHTTDPAYQFPAEVDDLSFVFRWAGKGGMLKWRIPVLSRAIGDEGWDTQLNTASLDTLFLNAWHISPQNLDELQLGEKPIGSKTLAEMDPLKTIEISIANWENPRITQQFVSGVLFNQARRRYRSTAENIARDTFEAFSPEATRRFNLVKMAASLDGRPFDDVMPLAALIRPPEEI